MVSCRRLWPGLLPSRVAPGSIDADRPDLRYEGHQLIAAHARAYRVPCAWSVAEPLDFDFEDGVVGRVDEEGDQSLVVCAERQGAQGSSSFSGAALVFGPVGDDHNIHELADGLPRGLA